MKTILVWTMILFTLSLSIGLPHAAAVDTSEWGLPEGAKARLGKGQVDELAYSPDGTLLAVASRIGIWIYDTDTLQERALLTGHTSGVTSVSFGPDGRTIASGSWDHTARLWDVATATQKGTLTVPGGCQSVSFSPDGSTIATGSYDRTVHLWDVATETQRGTLTGHTGPVNSVAFSPDGKTIASGSADNTVRLWDVATGTHKHTLTGHTGTVYSVSFSLDGKTIASGSQDNTVRLWDVATGTHKHTLTRHSSVVTSVVFSPDGRTIASGSQDRTVRLWDVVTATQKGTLTGHTDAISSVSFSPDGLTIASAGESEVRLWDVVTATQKGTLTGHTDAISSVSFSPDGKTIASAGWGEIVHLWDVETGTQKGTLTGHTDAISSVSFSPDGKTIASGSQDTTVRLWDVATTTHKHTFTGHTRGISSVSFSPDGSTIASGSDDTTVRLWDVATSTHKHTLTGHTDTVLSVSFSPDGSTIASSSRDNNIRLWDANTGELKHTLQGHTNGVYSVAFSPDGKTIASGSWDTTVRLWDVATATQKGTLPGYTNWVNSVSFSPDGKTIATGSQDDTVRLWDVATATHKHTLNGHANRVYSVSFSPDGTTLASGSDDGTVLLWDLTLYLDIAKEPTTDPEEPPVTIAPSRTGSDYQPDAWTLGLWHFDGENIADSSTNAVQGVIEGNAQWSTNQDWHEDAKPGHAFSFDGDTLITLGHADVLIPTDAVTVEAWVYPQDLSGWRLIGTNWDSPPGAYHLGVRGGFPQFEINTDQEGITFVLAEVQLELEQWSHLAGTYDSNLNLVKLYVNGVEVASMEHSGKLADNDFEVVIGSKNNRAFKWNGLIDEVRISSIARQPEELSPNLAIPTMTYLKEDVNRDGVVDIQDLMLVAADLTKMGEYVTDVNEDGDVNIADLVLVAGAQGSNTTAAVPALHLAKVFSLSKTDVEMWIAQAKQLILTDPKSLRGLRFLEQLLLTITPEKTALLANYPNPFNPETWIPYQLAKPAKVKLTIYAADGKLIRTLTLGHQVEGVYQNRNRAAYWDGKNEAGESVASGVYFYTLIADEFTATRKMLILK